MEVRGVTGTCVKERFIAFRKYVLNLSRNINDIGLPQWKLVICLAVCWLIVVIVMMVHIVVVTCLGGIFHCTLSVHHPHDPSRQRYMSTDILLTLCV